MGTYARRGTRSHKQGMDHMKGYRKIKIATGLDLLVNKVHARKHPDDLKLLLASAAAICSVGARNQDSIDSAILSYVAAKHPAVLEHAARMCEMRRAA